MVRKLMKKMSINTLHLCEAYILVVQEVQSNEINKIREAEIRLSGELSILIQSYRTQAMLRTTNILKINSITRQHGSQMRDLIYWYDRQFSDEDDEMDLEF